MSEIIKLQEEIDELKGMVNLLMTVIDESWTEDKFGIISSLSPGKIRDLLLDDNNNIFPDVSYTDGLTSYKILDIADDLDGIHYINLSELVYVYNVKIDGHQLKYVCHRDEDIAIIPKSPDLSGLVSLIELSKRLKKEGRIDNKNIAYLNKHCGCT